jgi:hypothetical protein
MSIGESEDDNDIDLLDMNDENDIDEDQYDLVQLSSNEVFLISLTSTLSFLKLEM